MRAVSVGLSVTDHCIRVCLLWRSVKSTSSLSMSGKGVNSLEEMSGSTAPIPLFDPLGLAASVDDQELQKYREAEVKVSR